jgi:hypothetical protein
MDMQKKVKIFLLGFVCVMLASVFVACGGYGHNYGDYGRYGYRNGSGYYQGSRDAFNYGYREGYEHGVSDRRHREDFNYSHDGKFRSGISSNEYVNQQFRQGYVRGYEQGYYGGGSYYRY